MPFVKVQKNKAYYKRIQTKYRRRREGKTDYHARRKMVTQEKNKYNSPKYRLVVRKTNKKIICQIVYATIQGDRVLTQATSQELTDKYGLPSGGLTNYAACYCTGLLVARRALKVVGLDEQISGVEECDGEEFHVEDEFEELEEGQRRPFKVILDVGLARTINGSRVWGVLKGAVDGGLYIPHKVRKFPGCEEGTEKGELEYDAATHRDRIMGVHVQEYMENLKEEDPERYQQVFRKFIAADHEDDIEDMYTECHAAIREDPAFVKQPKKDITHTRKGNTVVPSDGGAEYVRKLKVGKKMRMNTVSQKMQSAMARLAKGMEDDDEE